MASLAETYRKHTDIGHVLHAPDMYIGPIQPSDMTNWVLIREKWFNALTPSFRPCTRFLMKL